MRFTSSHKTRLLACQQNSVGVTWLVMSRKSRTNSLQHTSGALGRLVHYLAPGWDARSSSTTRPTFRGESRLRRRVSTGLQAQGDLPDIPLKSRMQRC